MKEPSDIAAVVEAFVDQNPQLESRKQVVVDWANASIAIEDQEVLVASLSRGSDAWHTANDNLKELHHRAAQLADQFRELVDAETLSDLLDALEELPEGTDAEARGRHPTAQPTA